MSSSEGRSLVAGQARNLALALWAFTITFWAWNLIGPLATRYTADLGLSTSQKSLIVATPVLVGALGRIAAGAMTDRFGGRLMMSILTVVSAIPVMLVCWSGNQGSYGMLLVSALLLGIAGTTFAVGVPFVSAWYDKSRRGLAVGLF